MNLLKRVSNKVVLFLCLLSLFSVLIPNIPMSHATTVTYQVSQGTDDCWKGYGDGVGWMWYTNKLDNEAGFWMTSDYKEGGGMRFQSVAIPSGAIITSAYMQFYYGFYGGDAIVDNVNNKIRGEAADNAATFSTLANFDARSYTTAYVDWLNIPHWAQGNWYNSPDISSIVQEIVNRGGWVSGNSIVLFRDDFDDRSSHIGQAARECAAYERGTTTAPKLVVTYTVTSGSSITASTPSVSTTAVGLYSTITTRWSTNGTLDKFIFGWDLSGSWVNDTATAFSSTNSTVSKLLDPALVSAGETVSFQFWGNTTTGESATTGLQSFTLTTASYTYTIRGPYYEDGTVANAITIATIYPPTSATQTNTFNGTDGVADIWGVALTGPADFIRWNITTSYNFTRLYYFTNETRVDLYLFVPAPGDSTQQYNINVIGLAPLTNAFVSVTENVNGVSRTLEQQKLDVINAMPFWLTMYNQYSFVISSDQGTWTYNLPADTIQTKTFTLTADMVTQTNNFILSTVTATRVNGTYISIYYYDPDGFTTQITTQIMHLYLGAYVVDATQTDYGYTQTFNWAEANAATSYIANITAVRSTGTLTWQKAIAQPSAAQYWLGTFDVFGVFPIPSYQLPAMFVFIVIFGVGGWRDTEELCLIGVVAMAILQVIGWGFFPTPGIVLAIMVIVFAYIHKGKQETTPLES
jgi:hypothetical protein